jgi:hypothetical protein
MIGLKLWSYWCALLTYMGCMEMKMESLEVKIVSSVRWGTQVHHLCVQIVWSKPMCLLPMCLLILRISPWQQLAWLTLTSPHLTVLVTFPKTRLDSKWCNMPSTFCTRSLSSSVGAMEANSKPHKHRNITLMLSKKEASKGVMDFGH